MKRFDFIRVKYFFYCLIKRSGFDHARFIKKHRCFHAMGENCFYMPYNLPADSKFIRFGNNVVVASNVNFICHDVIHHVLNHLLENSVGDRLKKVRTRDYNLDVLRNKVGLDTNIETVKDTSIGNNDSFVGKYRTYWNVIDIKDNCFIGANAMVLAGVTIGPNVVVAAGSVVNKDVPAGKVVGGVPAKVIGEFDVLKDKRLEYSRQWKEVKKEDVLKQLWEQYEKI